MNIQIPTIIRRVFVVFAFSATALNAVAADLVVGALLPLTGPSGSYGKLFGSGAEIAVDQMNEDSTLTQNVILQYEDSKALPEPGVIGMNKLIHVYKSPFVITGYTGVSKAIAPIANQSRVLAVNGGGVGQELADLGQYFWNFIPLINQELDVLVPYLTAERGVKRVALLYIDDPMGNNVLEYMKTTLPSHGAELVGSVAIAADLQQFSGVATQLRRMNADLIYIASYGTQELQIVKQLRDSGLSQLFASYSAFDTFSKQFMEMPQARDVLYTVSYHDLDANDPVTKRFVKDYKAKFNTMPISYPIIYYNAVHAFGILAQHLENEGLPITGENILAKSKVINEFPSVGGTIKLNPNGTVHGVIRVMEMQGNGQPAKVAFTSQ